LTLSEAGILGAYFACMALLAIYGAHRLFLVVLFLRHRARLAEPAFRETDSLPRLTVQLPLYNEAFVAGRLLDAVCRLDYPRDRLEIQILDDSTDSTRELCRRQAERYRAQGFQVRHLHRESRRGFKAGALAEGLRLATGEFIAIFDADFVPSADFARRALPCFADPEVGMVQARWGHLNRAFSALTRVQSIFLDGHFLIEQTARSRTGRYFNFNGTAGIWRRACIESAGGWQHDTLTEDLDLSYRAQMAGWRFVFLPTLVAEGELPTQMNAFKSQQHRWAKGSIQTGLKLLPGLLRSRVPGRVKAEAFFHLTGNLAYLLMVAVSLLYFPAMRIRERMEWTRLLALDLPILLLGSGSVLVFYLLSQREIGAGLWKTLRDLPCLMSVGMGLCLSNTLAVVEGLLGWRTDFVRTPKGVPAAAGSGAPAGYRARLSPVVLGELAGAGYFLVVLSYSVRHEIYVSIPFVLLFLSGFSLSAGRSLAEALPPLRRRPIR
jgi:cellulose synthase/poly-beta-1,6-N-acetylglucosamine synthase-like glycosyltransferase